MSLYLLSIAIDDYADFAPLSGAVVGAEALAQVLQERFGLLPENSHTLFDGKAHIEAIEQTLETFLPNGSTPLGDEDQLMVYFAGHGEVHPISQNSTLIPYNGKRNQPRSWLDYPLVQGYLRQLQARHVLLITDACFAGATFRDGSGETKPSDAVIKRLFELPSRYLLSSGGYEVVDDASFPKDGEAACQSVFSWGLVEYLKRCDDPCVCVEDLARGVRNKVVYNATQTPEYGWLPETGHQGGQLVLFQQGVQETSDCSPTAVDNAPVVETLFGTNPLLSVFDESTEQLKVLVTGMGGVGKTARVAEAISQSPFFQQKSVIWLDAGLATDNPHSLLRGFIAQCFPEVFLRDKEDHLLSALWQNLTSSFTGVLIIDNIPDNTCWQILAPAQTAHVIAISRYRLVGLEDTIALDLLNENTGMLLACHEANQGGSERLSWAEAKRLHHACDGLPLAIRVAGATIQQNPVLDVEVFITTLEDVRKDAPRTEDWDRRVMARLRLSIDHLSPKYRQLWGMLSVFQGVFARPALAALWQSDPPEIDLHHLLIRHLVLPAPVTTPTGSQLNGFRLHDLLKPLAEELFDPGQAVAGQRQLCQYFLSIVTETTRLAQRPKQPDLRDPYFLVSLNIDSIRNSIDFAKEDHDWSSAEAMVRFALDETLGDRMTVPDRLYLLKDAFDILERWRNEQPENYVVYRQKLLLKQGMALQTCGKIDEAETAFKEGLKLAQKLNSKPDQAMYHSNLGVLYLNHSGRTEEAFYAFDQSRRFASSENSPKEYFTLMQNCGDSEFKIGKLEEAISIYGKLESFENTGEDVYTESKKMQNAARIGIIDGNYSEVMTLAEKAAEVQDAIGLQQERAVSLQIAGNAAMFARQYDLAQTYLQAALEICQTYGQTILSIKIEADITSVLYEKNDIDGAFSQARICIRNAYQQGLIAESTVAMRIMALCFMRLGKLRSAYSVLNRTLKHTIAGHDNLEMTDDVLVGVQIHIANRDFTMARKNLDTARPWISGRSYLHQRVLWRALDHIIDEKLSTQ